MTVTCSHSLTCDSKEKKEKEKYTDLKTGTTSIEQRVLNNRLTCGDKNKMLGTPRKHMSRSYKKKKLLRPSDLKDSSFERGPTSKEESEGRPLLFSLFVDILFFFAIN